MHCAAAFRLWGKNGYSLWPKNKQKGYSLLVSVYSARASQVCQNIPCCASSPVATPSPSRDTAVAESSRTTHLQYSNMPQDLLPQSRQNPTGMPDWITTFDSSSTANSQTPFDRCLQKYHLFYAFTNCQLRMFRNEASQAPRLCCAKQPT